MLNSDVLWTKDHSNYIEAEGVAGQLVAGYPHFRGTAELPFFAPAYAGQWTAERQRFSCLYLDERHHPVRTVSDAPRRDQIYITMPVSEPLRRNLPAMRV